MSGTEFGGRPLGHANLETTQIYTQVSIRKLKAIHTAAHPGRLGKAGQHVREAEAEPEPTVEDLLGGSSSASAASGSRLQWSLRQMETLGQEAKEDGED